ncbi:MAG: ion channel [Chthoniobacterales bacterium]
MTIFLFCLGIFFLSLVGMEIFLTVLSLRGSGPITNFVTRTLWGWALKIHRWRPCHKALTLVGPALTLSAIIAWYLLVIAGWFLIFVSYQYSVVNNTTEVSADTLEKLYFVGATISSVGYGDFVPARMPWTLLANISAFSTAFFVTTALSYLMPVIAAALERRQLARTISALGEDAQTIVANSWTKGNGEVINSHWSVVFAAIHAYSLKHLVYPVLRYFHSDSSAGSSARSILNLADAVFLIEQAEDPESRPPPAFFVLANSAFQDHANIRRSVITSVDENDGDDGRSQLKPETLSELGITPKDDQAFQKALEEYLPLRSTLVNLCVEDGWRPEPSAAA